jgi:site-specific DNA-methyltransferase (adenine-specific)
MRGITISEIKVGPRQRKEMDATKLNELKTTIERDGLIHPVLLVEKPDGFHLVAGERRTRVMTILHNEGKPIKHDGIIIPQHMIPYTLTTDLSHADLLQLEFSENDAREALIWQDRVQALNSIHDAKVAATPSQTSMDTARELIADGTAPEQNTQAFARTIREAQIIARHLDDPAIGNARNHREAFKLAAGKEGREYEAELIRRNEKAAAANLNITLRHGDALKILPEMDEGFVDLILADPPYGISAGRQGFRDRSVHHHNYEDTPELARSIIKLLLVEGFRLCKPDANIFIFGDVDHFPYFKEVASQMGWTPWRRPLIWRKSNEGLAPWGQHGPRYTYDMVFYAKKGQRGLISSPTDVFDYSRVGRAEREYAAQKPVDLLSEIIECATLPGDFVLDPTMGSGSTLVAARALKRHGLGIEIDKSAYELAMTRVYEDIPDVPSDNLADIPDT